VPREKTGAEKEKKNMIEEEIKARQTNQEQSKKVSSGQDGAGVTVLAHVCGICGTDFDKPNGMSGSLAVFGFS